MNIPVALGAAVVVILVYAGWVESELRTCYFGRPPEPLPGERWRQAAAREIRRPRCLETSKQATTDVMSHTVGPDSTDVPRFAACQPLFKAGTHVSDVYSIYPSTFPKGACDMISGIHTKFSGGWIVIQRREDGSVNFTRSWAEYRDGFGNLTGEFWLGNEVLRRLTSEGNCELMVDLQTRDGDRHIAMYPEFAVKGGGYQLRVNRASSVPNVMKWSIVSLDDSLGDHRMKNFSTYDRDNDEEATVNCADQSQGGWWFGRCGLVENESVGSNLNGEYAFGFSWSTSFRGIDWDALEGTDIVKSEMKMRKSTKP